jgi:hypothetical protein
MVVVEVVVVVVCVCVCVCVCECVSGDESNMDPCYTEQSNAQPFKRMKSSTRCACEW